MHSNSRFFFNKISSFIDLSIFFFLKFCSYLCAWLMNVTRRQSYFPAKIQIFIAEKLFWEQVCKEVTKLEGLKFFLAVPKMVSFLQLAAEKKTPFLVQLKLSLALLIFVTALVEFKKCFWRIVSFGKTLHSFVCASLCSKSDVMLT